MFCVNSKNDGPSFYVENLNACLVTTKHQLSSPAAHLSKMGLMLQRIKRVYLDPHVAALCVLPDLF